MTIALILLQLAGLTNIARSNALVDQSAQAYAKGDYKKAADGYERMVRDYGRADDAVMANLGHAHYKAGNPAAAARAYQRLAQSPDPAMQSLGHGQLGVIADQQGNTPEAMEQMKAALRADPNNQLARLNLERLLRKQPKMKRPKETKKQEQERKEQEKKEQEKKEQEQKDKQKQGGQQDKQKQSGQDSKNEADKPQNQPKPAQDESKKGGQDGQPPPDNDAQKGAKGRNGQQQKPTGEEEKGKPNTDEKGKPKEDDAGVAASKEQLRKMQLPEDKARQLLEAMRVGEVQYLQQRRYRRKGGGDGKPGW